MNIKVINMKSPQGNKVPNQFIIQAPDGVYFQSYGSIIAKKTISGDIYLDQTYWDWSKTTGKYRNMFLNETKKETEQKIKEGVYRLVNLN